MRLHRLEAFEGLGVRLRLQPQFHFLRQLYQAVMAPTELAGAALAPKLYLVEIGGPLPHDLFAMSHQLLSHGVSIVPHPQCDGCAMVPQRLEI